MTESSPEDANSKRKDFICGVVEGFYGRPWTTEQRKDLFHKLKKWGMDMYVYAPKDDYKHRAYWRELYTVEEAEHLSSLISAAKSQGITFCYALSPGLDITYSSQKEITTLKRKLEQVSQFGCTCFALLFDDIEPEMSEADKQIFQSFAHAQVSVTNEIHQHLGCPRFLLCPTQYCSTRAVPTVNSSEYLITLGTKLSQQIDIMWTGPKVISKTLTTECIEEITQVLRRPPVIWDNLHANDYDQKRIFLGPYCGRSPELIPLLRGVLTNPNCEYNANMIPIWTLAHWASCSLDAPAHMEAVSWDIKLEREGEQGVCEDEPPLTLGKHVYHHRQALRQAINEWLPEFSIPKTAQGPVIKPQPPVNVPPAAIIPILPSVNTCMSLVTGTSTTCTTSTCDMAPHVPTIPTIPTINTSQLQALAEVCSATPDRPILSTGISPIETFNPVSNPVMNSLVSPTKVILNESIPNPIIPMASSNMALPSEIPVSTLPVPIMGLKALEGQKALEQKVDHPAEGAPGGSFAEDVQKTRDEEVDPIVVDEAEQSVDAQRNGEMSVGDTPQTLSPSRPSAPLAGLEPLEPLEPLDVDPPSTAATDSDVVMNDGLSENGSMQVEPSNSPLSGDMMVEPTEPTDEAGGEGPLTAEDLVLLCDLFYLPFEHGSRGLRLLHDFNWLLAHAASLLPRPDNAEVRPVRSAFAPCSTRVRFALAPRSPRVRSALAPRSPRVRPAFAPRSLRLRSTFAPRSPRLRLMFAPRSPCTRSILPVFALRAGPSRSGALQSGEWRRRLRRFYWWAGRARRLSRRLSAAANRELHAELHPYLWELCAVLALLVGFLRWLELGKFPQNIASNIQGSYTWFSKGWREAFESGAQEPWVFRGGLTADLRRLLAVECGADLLRPLPAPPAPPLALRPYRATDERKVSAAHARTLVHLITRVCTPRTLMRLTPLALRPYRATDERKVSAAHARTLVHLITRVCTPRTLMRFTLLALRPYRATDERKVSAAHARTLVHLITRVCTPRTLMRFTLLALRPYRATDERKVSAAHARTLVHLITRVCTPRTLMRLTPLALRPYRATDERKVSAAHARTLVHLITRVCTPRTLMRLTPLALRPYRATDERKVSAAHARTLVHLITRVCTPRRFMRITPLALRPYPATDERKVSDAHARTLVHLITRVCTPRTFMRLTPLALRPYPATDERKVSAAHARTLVHLITRVCTPRTLMRLTPSRCAPTARPTSAR
ncbi:unnamed protein product, partial [Iphiclides podalirius]